MEIYRHERHVPGELPFLRPGRAQGGPGGAGHAGAADRARQAACAPRQAAHGRNEPGTVALRHHARALAVADVAVQPPGAALQSHTDVRRGHRNAGRHHAPYRRAVRARLDRAAAQHRRPPPHRIEHFPGRRGRGQKGQAGGVGPAGARLRRLQRGRDARAGKIAEEAARILGGGPAQETRGNNMNVTNLDLNLLRVFDAMMIERNVTRAAPRVHLSQPAASHALARLREAIGDPLFVRSGNEMVPTARALALGPAVRKMLEQLGSVLVGESFDPRLETAAFKIAMVDFAEYLIAPMFSRLIAEEAPHIRLMVSAPEAASLEASLADGELDMALGIFDAAGAGIHSRSLAPLRMVAVVREGHPLAGRRLTAAEFSSVPRLAIASGGDAASTLYERQLAKAGLGGEVVYVTQNFLSVPQVLASTDLALITSERVAQTLCAHKPLVV